MLGFISSLSAYLTKNIFNGRFVFVDSIFYEGDGFL